MSRTLLLGYPPTLLQATASTVEGKFLQLRYQGNEYLLFASRDAHRFHNQMLARFLGEHGIAHRWLDGESLQFDTALVTVCGGGRFRYRGAENRLELWDNSQAYGRFDAAGLAHRIAAADHPLAGAEVVIR